MKLSTHSRSGEISSASRFGGFRQSECTPRLDLVPPTRIPRARRPQPLSTVSLGSILPLSTTFFDSLAAKELGREKDGIPVKNLKNSLSSRWAVSRVRKRRQNLPQEEENDAHNQPDAPTRPRASDRSEIRSAKSRRAAGSRAFPSRRDPRRRSPASLCPRGEPGRSKASRTAGKRGADRQRPARSDVPERTDVSSPGATDGG